MKKIIGIMLVLFFVSASMVVNAQTEVAPVEQVEETKPRRNKGDRIERRMAKMSKDLNLTDAQSQEIRQLLEEKMELRAKGKMEKRKLKEEKKKEKREKYKAKRSELRAELNAKMKTILTEEQYIKYLEMGK